VLTSVKSRLAYSRVQVRSWVEYGYASQGSGSTWGRISLAYSNESTIPALCSDPKAAELVNCIIVLFIVVRDLPHGVSSISLIRMLAEFYQAYSCPQVSSSSTLPTISTPTSSWNVTCFSLPFLLFFFPFPFSLFGSLPSSSSKSPASRC
jgi:hypothetical protein